MLAIVALGVTAIATAPAIAADAQFPPDRLEQLVAPIALYPDPLLMNILMASTYPLEIVQADRWIQSQKGLRGAALGKALESQSWDASVESPTHFPDVLGRMSKNLDWTSDLGDAFLAQQAAVLDAVQRMRKAAQDQGNLESTKEGVAAAFFHD